MIIGIIIDMQEDFVNGPLGTPEAHKAALTVMQNCLIDVLEEV